jgi:hypothetical protein
MSGVCTRDEHVVTIDYGQVYIYGRAEPIPPADPDEAFLDLAERIERQQADVDASREIRALNAAYDSGHHVAAVDGLIVMLSPYQWHFDAELVLEVRPSEPDPSDLSAWDQVVDLDLDLPDGQVAFEAPTHIPVWLPVEAGSYRARVCGRGFDASHDQLEGGPDSYRLALWPRAVASARPPELRRAWPGWTS